MALFAASLATLLLATAPVQEEAPGQKSLTDEEIGAVVLDAAQWLLGSAENYQPDRPVGRIPEARFDKWQERERKRLDKLRGKRDAAEWPYEGVYRVGRKGQIPSGYRVGGTSIAAVALLTAGLEGKDRETVEAAADRALEFVFDRMENDRTMALGPKEGYDVRGWGHAYAIQLMLTMLDQKLVEGDDAVAKVNATIDDMIGRLAANQTEMGGWNYANDKSVSPFMTGATLLILYQAVDAGFEVDEAMITKALDALEACSTEAGSYAYSGASRRAVPMPGSSARSACATLALHRAGRRDDAALRGAVVGFFEGWQDLLARKSKQGTHEGPYGIAPYYFFFGHTYASFAIQALPAAERKPLRDELVRLLMKTREDDGTWNDRIFPRTASYSTAMAVMALRAPALDQFPEWSPSADK